MMIKQVKNSLSRWISTREGSQRLSLEVTKESLIKCSITWSWLKNWSLKNEKVSPNSLVQWKIMCALTWTHCLATILVLLFTGTHLPWIRLILKFCEIITKWHAITTKPSTEPWCSILARPILTLARKSHSPLWAKKNSFGASARFQRVLLYSTMRTR